MHWQRDRIRTIPGISPYFTTRINIILRLFLLIILYEFGLQSACIGPTCRPQCYIADVMSDVHIVLSMYTIVHCTSTIHVPLFVAYVRDCVLYVIILCLSIAGFIPSISRPISLRQLTLPAVLPSVQPSF